MFLIEKEEVMAEIKKINDYMEKCLWMDFTLCQSSWGSIEFYGAIDQTYNNYVDNYEIKLVFDYPHFVSSLFSWTAKPSRPFINLCSVEKEAEMIMKYNVEQGNYIFEINAEGYDSPPIIVSAKKIACEILNEKPFPSVHERVE